MQQIKQTNMRQSHESGFTLVELAIVMLIIGLLVGGVLKGQEMIESARVSSTVQDMESFDAAINTFNDRFAALPGDVDEPNKRLPNCENLCANEETSGNGRLDKQKVSDALKKEGAAVWTQLGATGLIKGVQADATQADDLGVIGKAAPAADIGGGFIIGWHASDKAHLNNNRHYLYILRDISSAGGGMDASNVPMTPVQARQIDEKLDDGHPERGIVRASDTSADGDSCKTDPGDGFIYDTSVTSTICSVYKDTM